MPPALRKVPVPPARAAAVLASLPDCPIAHQLLGALAPEPTRGTLLVWAVPR